MVSTGRVAHCTGCSHLFSACLLRHALCSAPISQTHSILPAAAAFVTASAVGMAVGPLLAEPLQRLPTMQLGSLTIDPITAGAYLMLIIWVAFLAVTIFCFADPRGR